MVKSHIAMVRGLKETPQAMALRALRAIIKSSNTALQLDRVPATLLFGDKIDFHRWSLILRDEELHALSQQKDFEGPVYCLDTSAATVACMFRPFWHTAPYTHGIIELNLANAVDVTDYGLTVISRANPSLAKLNLTNCGKISDIGLREVALSCPHLFDLNISSCPEIQGEGILAVAESCFYLTKLNITHNTQILNYSLQRIFRKCTHLEHVNLSYMKEITDNEIRYLAENCLHLFHFEAVECRYISDQSVLSLTQYCRELSYLDLSRTDMTYRVSDIALMSLGQRSSNLLTCKLNHCDSISDTGLTWLSEGCPLLEVLEIYGCNKITDAGLRSLSTHCTQLTSLDISHAKLISDVGIAHLSHGCRKLKILKCHGVFLLSDPRFFPEISDKNNSTKNRQNSSINLTFEDPIGIPALVHNCPELVTLDLSHCFRLNKVFSYHISSLAKLQKINIRGCNQVSSISLVSLVSGCVMLTEVDMSECGKGVNNEVLLSLQRNCPDIKILLLHKSSMITTMGIKAIALMKKLKRLELNGCIHLTDSMCVSLTQVGKTQQLTDFSIIDCTSLTDSFLAWLSMKSDHKIMTLATQNSNITKKALLSCREQFPNSEIIFPSTSQATLAQPAVVKGVAAVSSVAKSLALNSPFASTSTASLTAGAGGVISTTKSSNSNNHKGAIPVTMGYIPKFRIHDILLINHYYKVIISITKLQARQRKYHAIRLVQNIQDFIRRVTAQRLIQRIVRGFLARMQTHELRWQQKTRQKSAMKITSLFHMVIAWKTVQHLHRLKQEKYLHMAVMKLQVLWRSYHARKLLHKLKMLQLTKHQLRVLNTMIIQSVMRMYQAKKQVFHIRNMKHMKNKLWHHKAIIIQRIHRGNTARNLTKKMKRVITELKILRWKSVMKIQYQVRKHRTKTIIQQMHSIKQERYHSATIIQAVIRGFLTRLSYQEIFYEYQLLRRKKATLRIQCLYRVYKARIAFFNKLKVRTAQRQNQADASLIITRAARMKLAVIRFQEKQRMYNEKLHTQAMIALNAAIKIQSLYRRYHGRWIYFRKLEEKKSKWKELFDEEQGKRFFYNQQTGEIRWRIPQDLLDLVPHPVCDNCCSKEAILECKVCNELYCGPCFNHVHYGGRRKLHEYRSLYDFYGKRLDYGDGDFPCQWPSEVIQDEIQGWMLRVAPQRPPRHIYKQSPWEEYQMEDDEIAFKQKNSLLGMTAEQQRVQASIGKAAPLVFYFNRQTFETSYEMPPAVQAELNQHQNKRSSSTNSNNNSYLITNYDGAAATTGVLGATTAAADPMTASSQYLMQLAMMGTGRVSTTAGGNNNEEVDYSAQGYYDPNGNWVWYESDYPIAPAVPQEGYQEEYYAPPSYGGDATAGGNSGGRGIAYDGYATNSTSQQQQQFQQKQQQKTSTITAMMRSSTGHSYHYGSLQEEYYHDLSSDTGSHM